MLRMTQLSNLEGKFVSWLKKRNDATIDGAEILCVTADAGAWGSLYSTVGWLVAMCSTVPLGKGPRDSGGH